MLQSIPSALFTEWQAFNWIEPFGEWRQDYRAGQIAQVLANLKRDPKKQSKPFTPMDFIPDFTTVVARPATKAASIEDLKMKMMAIATAFKDRPATKRTK